MTPTVVAVGQIWEDMDPRRTSRRWVRIVRIAYDGTVAEVEVVEPLRLSGRLSKIQVSRLRPGKTGYRYIEG